MYGNHNTVHMLHNNSVVCDVCDQGHRIDLDV